MNRFRVQLAEVLIDGRWCHMTSEYRLLFTDLQTQLHRSASLSSAPVHSGAPSAVRTSELRARRWQVTNFLSQLL